MALSDPQSITIDGTAISLPLISRESGKSSYRAADGSTIFEVWHTSSGSRKMDSERITVFYNVTDPITGLVKRESTTVTVLTNRPKVGRAADADVKQTLGLLAFVSASSGATHLRVLQGES